MGQPSKTYYKWSCTGVVISSDLSWKKNTKQLVQRAYRRTILLHKLFEFAVPEEDLITIYVLFIRLILEQSCVVWHSSMTQEEQNNLERVQKSCLRVILKQNYICYEDALVRTKLETLHSRRQQLCLYFALNCTRHEKNSDMFPLNNSDHSMSTNMRNHEKYEVQYARIDRLGKSAMPYLQRQTNIVNRKLCIIVPQVLALYIVTTNHCTQVHKSQYCFKK